MTLDAPAFYLECRYDRVVALRLIARNLHRDLYRADPYDTVRLTRLCARLARAHRHLAELTGSPQ